MVLVINSDKKVTEIEDSVKKQNSFFHARKPEFIEIQNRRFLGNKHKLLKFIDSIIYQECGEINSIADIFAGTGVVGSYFNKLKINVISNDILLSNFVALSTFLGTKNFDLDKISLKIEKLNSLNSSKDNYFSKNFGDTYFNKSIARKIGAIREEIDIISDNEEERNILLTSLLYAVDKIANTVGHYDAYIRNSIFREDKNFRLLVPKIESYKNKNNEIYKEDANELIKKITCDVLYVDPPYNSRQYSDSYHLLENLISWRKPEVFGIAKKMDRSHLKSKYCLKGAPEAFADLIKNAKCKYILISYNNTSNTKNHRSNARISDEQIIKSLKQRGTVKIFEMSHKAFTTGKSSKDGNSERIFFCKVTKQIYG